MGESSLLTSKLNLERRQIRIIRLLRGYYEDPVKCELWTAHLDEGPEYEALSYAWGDPSQRCPILLDGAVFQVTTNLEAALRRIRDPAADRNIWVDALCINQADDVEKSHQVNLMKFIYPAATRGLVWLGDSGYLESNADWPLRTSLYASESLSHGGTSAESSIKGVNNSTSTEKFRPSLISERDAANAFRMAQLLADNAHMDRIPVELFYALRTLLELPWWDRIWTVQETVLPREVTVLCCSLQLPIEVFLRAGSNFYMHNYRGCCPVDLDLSHIPGMLNRRLAVLEYCRGDFLSSEQLHHILTSFRSRSASDDRDMIYGLLGLFYTTPIRPDYSRRWDKVYRGTQRSMILETNSLAPLLRTRELSRRSCLPSWVPDWAAPVQGQNVDEDLAWVTLYKLYNAAAGTALRIKSGSDKELRLKGVEVDEIVAVEGPTYDHGIFNVQSSIEKWRSFARSRLKMSDTYPYGEGTYADAFWRVFVNDLEIKPSDNPTMGDCVRLDPSNHKDSLDRWIMDEKVASHYAVNMRDRNLFITKRGFIGSASPDARVGDCVHILHGGNLPFVLRAAQKRWRRRCYEYVGHAYVQGIMDGEFMWNAKSAHWYNIV
ncbi:heterokaryon incompatibility protein-domain-containing protein [Xylariales sp. PMI_506]|nr:heterokaryon incompatibility protein-domain-containing protein [Xylariales sp. PMI_506]